MGNCVTTIQRETSNTVKRSHDRKKPPICNQKTNKHQQRKTPMFFSSKFPTWRGHQIQSTTNKRNQITIPLDCRKKLNDVKITLNDITNWKRIAKVEHQLLNLFIILILPDNNIWCELQNQNDNVEVIYYTTITNIMDGIKTTISRKFNVTFDGIFVAFKGFISGNSTMYRDQNGTGRYINKFRDDIRFALNRSGNADTLKQITIIPNYSKCVNVNSNVAENSIIIKARQDSSTLRSRNPEQFNQERHFKMLRCTINSNFQSPHTEDLMCNVSENTNQAECSGDCFPIHTDNTQHILTAKDIDKEQISKMQCANQSICNINKPQIPKQRVQRYNKINTKLIDIIDLKENGNRMFRFGARFHYVDDSIYRNVMTGSAIAVRKKHTNFKLELIQNDIQHLSMIQYDQEREKAKILLCSNNAKEQYTDKMTVDHILALKIYCNFDSLQHAFTETYWKTAQHSDFYHLGRFVQETIHEFGTPLENELEKKFYHGMTNKLRFPSFINHVRINCPLSTSSELDVAINFTDQNNGLIVEFCKTPFGRDGSVKQISCAWVSNYPNECEHLFIQCTGMMQINNILDPTYGFEYSSILNALRIINHVLNGLSFNDSTIGALPIRVVEHQLSHNSHNANIYKHLKGLTPYGDIIIRTYFANKKILKINFEHKNVDCYIKLLHDSFLHQWQNGQWINIMFINTLCQNIELIWVENIWLSEIIMNEMYKDLDHLKSMRKTKLLRIEIICNQSVHDPFNIENYILTHQQRFASVNFTLTTESNRLYVVNTNTNTNNNSNNNKNNNYEKKIANLQKEIY
eukprot:55479_1